MTHQWRFLAGFALVDGQLAVVGHGGVVVWASTPEYKASRTRLFVMQISTWPFAFGQVSYGSS